MASCTTSFPAQVHLFASLAPGQDRVFAGASADDIGLLVPFSVSALGLVR